MNAFVGLLCLVAVSVSAEEYKIMDSGITPFTDKKCDGNCADKMKAGLDVVNELFRTILQSLDYTVGFCNGSVTGLAGFKITNECNMNEDGTIYDHSLSLEFDNPQAIFNCDLPNSPAAAAKRINDAYLSKGKCGKEGVGDKYEVPEVACDGDASDAEDKPVTITADLKGLKLTIVIRVDVQDPEKEEAFPLSFTFTTADKNPASLKDGEGFQDAYNCVTNDANIKSLFKRMFFSAFKPLFTCLDDKNEEKDLIVGPLLLMAGRC